MGGDVPERRRCESDACRLGDLAGTAGSGTRDELLTSPPGSMCVGGGFAVATCLARMLSMPELAVGQLDPAAGEGLYYLAPARNACGWRGAYTDSTPVPDQRDTA